MLTVPTWELEIVDKSVRCEPIAGDAPEGYQRVWTPAGRMALQELGAGQARKEKRKESYKAELIAWVDVETTGLDPEVDLLLEYGLIVTDGQLNELVREVQPVWYDTGVIDAALDRPDRAPEINAGLRHMHTESGLLDDCASASLGLDDFDDYFMSVLITGARELDRRTGRHEAVLAGADGHGVQRTVLFEGERRPILGGCTPFLDRAMTKAHLPNFYKSLSRWTLDATCLKIAFETWAGQEIKKREKETIALPYYRRHRAMGDLEDALDLARRCRQLTRCATGFDPVVAARGNGVA